MVGNKSIKECAEYLEKYEQSNTFVKNASAVMHVLYAISTIVDSAKSVKNYLNKDKKSD
jgi:hypothetical protein